MRKNRLLLSAALAAVVVPALAEPSETVVVSATRSAQKLEVTGTSLAVLSGEELTSRQTVMLTDALGMTPGIAVNRVGGAGQTATVSVRGAESGQTVALIDGIRLNDPSDVSGAVPFGDLLLNNTQRIEVLRGPQSTLYGSDAIGGVVDITTRRGGDRPFALAASVEGGSYASWRLNAAANGSVGRVDYGVALNDFGTNGISAANSRRGNAEADGYRNIGATINTRTRLVEGVSLDLRGYYTHAQTDYDDGYQWVAPYALTDSAAYDIHSLYAGYVGANADAFGGRLRNRLALIATSGTRDYYDSASDTEHLNYAYSSGSTRFEYQGTVDLDATQVTFGAESEAVSFVNESVYSYMAAERVSGGKTVTGGYGQVQQTLFDVLTLTAGVRYDHDGEFGGHTSTKIAAAWQVPEWNLTLRANYGDGFKAPTLYQLYSNYSNPIAKLKPETAKGWEAGVDKNWLDGRIAASLTYFERRNWNQIDFQTCYSAADAAGCAFRLTQYGYYVNIDRTKTSGVEVALSAALSDTLKLTANYTNMSAIDRTTGLDLARRPQETANVALFWHPLDALNLGASVNVTGKRFNDAANATKLGAFETAGVFADYALDDMWQVYGRIDNLFDDRTERVTYYGTPGISATFGIRAKI